MKDAFRELCRNRRLQVALASILTGTRFEYCDRKIAGGSTRLPTQCRTYGEKDSPAHILEHMGGCKAPNLPEEIITFLESVAKMADAVNPHISTPFLQNLAFDLGLDLDEDEDESSIELLPFFGDHFPSL